MPAVFLRFIVILVALSASSAASAQQMAGAESALLQVKIGYLRAYEPQLALSVLDVAPRDEGLAGADVAIADNNTTGKFLGQIYSLAVTEVMFDADVRAAAQDLISKGANYILADISAEQLLSVADLARERNVLILNVGATDDRLREEACASHVFHTAPTRSMLADGLAQYLIWKQWRRWVLIYGSHERDRLYADAIRRAATRFVGELLLQQDLTAKPR
ncbi:MAG: ABC transporter substrate-binding protein, partial [Pseudomonadota bacterium]|nr:ABC transporter substrate-binding protein [Pseudomonadota bacterium]